MDYNSLQNNAFTFSLERIPETSFRVTGVNHPSISVQPTGVPTPSAQQYLPGTVGDFSELTLEFLVDENMDNYTELYTWITLQRYSNELGKSLSDKELVSDGFLMTLTNSANSNKVLTYHDMFPIALGGFYMDSTVQQPEPVRCTATFKFSYFSIK